MLIFVQMLKHWINAARPKTLALAVSGPLVGIALALFDHVEVRPTIAILCVLTAIFLQILSNFANDLGDYQKGTDQVANRSDRALSSGVISEIQMKIAVVLFGILSLGIGLLLLQMATLNSSEILTLLGIGLVAIIAAIAYTVGKKAYGYYGWGDFFVFIFFGLVSVLATNYIFTRHLILMSYLGAAMVGFFSTMVLNINNIRDMDKDKLSYKRTIPVFIGFANSRIYHILLAAAGCVSLVIIILKYNAPIATIPLLFFVYILHHFLNLKTGEVKAYNEQLKQTSLTTLLVALTLLGHAIYYS